MTPASAGTSPLDRRRFLILAGGGAAVAAVSCTAPSIVLPPGPGRSQAFNPDFKSNPPGVEYYFLGNGRIQVAVQSVVFTEDGTQAGVLLMSPDHFGRKASSLLFHPERGLHRSRISIRIGNAIFTPEAGSARMTWDYGDGIPTVVVKWPAGPLEVTERFRVPADEALLVREVHVANGSAARVEAKVISPLYPNLMLFDEYAIDRERATLIAEGYHRLSLFTTAEKPSKIADRHLEFDLGLEPGAGRDLQFVLALNVEREEVEKKSWERRDSETREYWGQRADLVTGDEGLTHLFRSARTGLRAAVATSGKVDGGIWQYNLEWSWDQSMIVTACSMLGLTDISGTMLRRMLTRCIDDEGGTVDASRRRPVNLMEINSNGALLRAIRTHWAWTGDDALLSDHWDAISRVAEYCFKPELVDPDSGLLHNERELWEREPLFGVKDGFEMMHQLFISEGLSCAAELAGVMGKRDAQQKWSAAAARMKESFLRHPKYSLIEGGRIIKRRLMSGEVQWQMNPPDRSKMPAGMPMAVETENICDPDSVLALPVAHEFVDPRSDVARRTLEAVEKLWNQRWDFGGYSRYDVSSEPDSPGPWPLATMFMARAYLEAGNDEKVWRALRWMLEIPGGKSGAWFEHYGPRPVPPLPPVGIVVWTWAEIAFFFVHHLLGVRPGISDVTIRPRLPVGLDDVRARLFIRGKQIDLHVRRTGTSIGPSKIPLPDRDLDIEISI